MMEEDCKNAYDIPLSLFAFVLKVRFLLEMSRSWECARDIIFSDFPLGCCELSSCIIMNLLLHQKLPVLMVYGCMKKTEYPHVWCESEDIIIDLTGEQFLLSAEEAFLPYFTGVPVFVDRVIRNGRRTYSTWHYKVFKIEKKTSTFDYRQLDDDYRKYFEVFFTEFDKLLKTDTSLWREAFFASRTT